MDTLGITLSVLIIASVIIGIALVATVIYFARKAIKKAKSSQSLYEHKGPNHYI